MPSLVLIFLCMLIIMPVFGQNLPGQENNPGTVNLPVSVSNKQSSSTSFMGQHPFQPYLVQKVAIGHPEGIFGIGIRQQYMPHPYPFTWQNRHLMQPVSGLPKYPDFVLTEASPSIINFGSRGTLQSFSVGQMQRDGINKQFRQIKIVKGLPVAR
jgi:hypothetical protein